MKMERTMRIATFYSIIVRIPSAMWQMKMPKYPVMNRGFLLKDWTVKMPAICANKLITLMIIVPVRGVKLPPVVTLVKIALDEYIMTSIPTSYLSMTCTKFTQLAFLYLALDQKASLRVTRLVSFWIVDLIYSLVS